MLNIDAIQQFLTCETPKKWLDQAVTQIPTLLIDHAHCERKAAMTALNFISKYSEKEKLIEVMSPLAREELLHFEKVLSLLSSRRIVFGPLKPSRYAQHLHQKIARSDYLLHLTDELIVGAIIEARSCERFYSLLSYLDDEILVKFYQSLVKAEARHFEDYIALARLYCPEPIEPRIQKLLSIEEALIHSADEVFRFHGGIPPQV